MIPIRCIECVHCLDDASCMCQKSFPEFKDVTKKLVVDFNYLQVYYDNGSYEFSKDSSDKIWDRFRKLSVFFVENPWSGISKIVISDNEDRVIMSVTNHLI